MMKQAFRSYIASLHPTKMKHAKKNDIQSVITMIVIWIMWDLMSGDKLWDLIYRMIPILLIKWSNLDGNIYMGKAMLLCPMKYESRKQYINYFLIFKIAFPIIIGCIIEIIWSYVYGADFARAIVLLLIYFSIGIASAVHIDCFDKIDHKTMLGRKDKNGTVKWAWQNFAASCNSLFLLLDCCMSELGGNQSQFYILSSLVGVVILIILDVFIMYTQYKDMIEETIDYELAFRVPGRLHYIGNE